MIEPDMIKALIFDVDGTLAETEDLGHRRAFNYAFQHLGFKDFWSQALYRDLLKVAGGKERIQHYFHSTSHPEAGNSNLVSELHKFKTEFYKEIVAQGEIILRPGVEQLITQAKEQNIRLAIATTTSEVNIHALLESAPGPLSLDYFETIACAENAPIKKPAPDVYLLALAQLRLDPEDVIAFEDNSNGLRSANAAGISKVVITPTFLSRDENFESAWKVLNDLSEFQLNT